jgi:hypothetical protein
VRLTYEGVSSEDVQLLLNLLPRSARQLRERALAESGLSRALLGEFAAGTYVPNPQMAVFGPSRAEIMRLPYYQRQVLQYFAEHHQAGASPEQLAALTENAADHVEVSVEELNVLERTAYRHLLIRGTDTPQGVAAARAEVRRALFPNP